MTDNIRAYLELHDRLTKLWLRAVRNDDYIAQRVFHEESMRHEIKRESGL